MTAVVVTPGTIAAMVDRRLALGRILVRVKERLELDERVALDAVLNDYYALLKWARDLVT